MGNGYWQKILRVDLATGKSRVERIDEDVLRKYIGGAGLAGKIIHEEVPAKIEPYGDENLLIFSTGPFQGPAIPGGAKFSISAISPLTGTFADSAAGAGWGVKLKEAGYDVLVIEGSSSRPVYLVITDDLVRIEDASRLWGLDTYQTIDAVHDDLANKKYSVACIGPAGERKVAIACIAVDKHSFAGRCGLGAIMGGKNLKAVVVKGSRKVEPFAGTEASAAAKVARDNILATLKKGQWHLRGTTASPAGCEAIGDLPIKYWQGDVWSAGAKRLSHPNYTKLLKAKPQACRFCPVGCHRAISFTRDDGHEVKGAGPEYETLALMGSNLLVDDPVVVAQANDMANKYGIDTISAGAMIGFAIECYENGWLSTFDTGGLELKWGSSEVLLALVEQISLRQGFGAIFAAGTLKAAKKIHPEAPAIVAHCKGLDFPGHDPRSCISLAPSYATSTRGACHYRGPCEDVEMGLTIPEIGIDEDTVDYFRIENQSEMAAKCQDLASLLNSLACCTFMVTCVGESITEIKDIFNGLTGWEYSVSDLMEAGERAFTVQRLINIRDGYGAKTDTLPKKMLKSAKEGFRADQTPPFETLMGNYYRWRGWNEDGVPTEETLSRLLLDQTI